MILPVLTRRNNSQNNNLLAVKQILGKTQVLFAIDDGKVRGYCNRRDLDC
jgi:hypothetical protein